MDFLLNNALFKNMGKDEVMQLITSVGYVKKTFNPGEAIVHQGDVITNIGIVVTGKATGIKYTPEGEEIIVSRMKSGSVFGDVLSGANGFASPVAVQAGEDCSVMFIDYKGLLFSDFPATHKVLQNMIENISHKYFNQSRRMDILMLKSVRSKIVAYLEGESSKKSSRTFDIDLDRRLLADFLGVDRSALSRELSRMKAEGLIEYRKNSFKILW